MVCGKKEASANCVIPKTNSKTKEPINVDRRWDAGATTVIVAEGLLMYLLPQDVGTLFRHCAAVTGDDSRIAFTYIGTRLNGQPDAGPWTWLVLWMLKAGGEPFYE